MDEQQKLWPCVSRDYHGEQRYQAMLETKKRKGLLPCQDLLMDELNDNFADFKELGHARIPTTCSEVEKKVQIDRSSGDHPGLVDGDYISSELASVNYENRIYTAVCLRGTEGMHLIELSEQRARQKTWKFCFYQAIVALDRKSVV